MDSILEVQRQTHEEQTHETKLQAEHKASQILDRVSARVVALKNSYEDGEARKAEIEALSSRPDDLSEFYTRLGKIQEHYAKYPESGPSGFELELAAFLDETEDFGDEEYEEDDPIALLFSGEEQYGKYLDLYANHSAYNNLKYIGKRLGYLQYLDVLLAAQITEVHSELSTECRQSRDYELYVKALHTYLLSFMKRARPLVDLESQQKEAEVEFEKKWEAGTLGDWKEVRQPNATRTTGEGIWCAACQKMYSKQTVYDAHLTSKRHVKATAKQASSDQPPSNPNGPSTSQSAENGTPPPVVQKSKHRTAALLTFLSTQLLASLISVLNETKSNVERRFSLTAREREQELLEQSKPKAPPPTASGINGENPDEEEEEERIYNPLKLPLGWDGKPIPYWLYKLHGLGVEYRCEILAEKLKREGRNEIFEQETMEELEDEDGNVYNRKTYEDLKKQGLI
ncbi:hypothetical protein EUX98_g7379 [Antrodiella citrinella]|uniref:U1-type domain-containing protein n=1 Tax=Antrodiella citrinella TaxID=2447956 RepID=A0A4S4MLZ1_9APHY|nr:hypothetical protein EUX98_g7379 [Antrodiella citrinella]